jgi:hypothetical protein
MSNLTSRLFWGCLITLFFLCGIATAAVKNPMTPLFDIPRLDHVTIDGKDDDWGQLRLEGSEGFVSNYSANPL